MIEVRIKKSNRLMSISIVLLALSLLAIFIAPVAAAPAPPTFVSATTNTAGTVITITFSEAMARSIFRAGHEFTYSINGGRAQSFRAIAINSGGNTMIDLTISGRPIAYGDTVIVNYAAGTVKAQNGGVLASFSNEPVTNAVPAPPTFVSATTNTAGTVITITFSEAMANPTRRAAYEFTYGINGGRAQSFRAIAINSGGNTMIDLTISGRPIASGETVTVRYMAGTVKAQNGGTLASFRNEPVTNAVPAFNAPVLYTVTYDGNGATGGTVPTDPNTYPTGATVPVQGNTGNLVRAGYTFDGWNTSPDGTGMIFYNPGDTFTIGSADVTLYAMWGPPA